MSARFEALRATLSVEEWERSRSPCLSRVLDPGLPAERVGLRRAKSVLVPKDLPGALGYNGRQRYLMVWELDGEIVMAVRPESVLGAVDSAAWSAWMGHPAMKAGAEEIAKLMPDSLFEVGVMLLDMDHPDGIAVYVGEMYRAVDLLEGNRPTEAKRSHRRGKTAMAGMEQWLNEHYCP